MSQKLLQAVAQNTRFRLVNLLKRTQGLSVQDLADRLEMSYMGVKEACQDLERRGLVDARREPKPDGTTGRPRLVYRLTARAHDLFPKADHSLTLELLEVAKKLHGPASAEKILMLTWQGRTEEARNRCGGAALGDRAGALARWRDEQGHMAAFEADQTTGKGRIVEHHCPYLDVLRAYPSVAKLDAELFSKVIGSPVRREERSAGGLLQVEFVIE